MRTFIVTATLLALTLGCTGISFVSRPVREDDPWFVRLQTYAQAGKAGDVQHNHPASWNESDLNAILSGLYLTEQVGLLDQKPVPRPIFSPEDVARLAPAVQEAFRLAQPNEWVTFFLTHPAGQGEEVTSGALYVDGQQLHVIVANDREVMPVGEEARTLKANPLRALKVRGRTLTFDPAAYVIFSRNSWMSGYDNAAASEVILDHRKFLASLKQTPAKPAAAAPQPPPQAASVPATEDLKATVKQLQGEIEQLKRRLAEQDAELAKRKSRSGADASKKKPAPKQPVQ
ncbi:MAG: hypothetical protein EPO61_02945 [Nitrospirae bacterium]|nr:MAG: hypothetical protein EPO61_02945 [Nitrospirota bacterium]